MAWKGLKQRSLADSMLIDHDALKDLGSVNEQIYWSRLERLLQSIYTSPHGEKACPRRVRWG